MAGETSGSFSSMNLRFFFSHNLQTTCYMVLEFKGKYFNDRKELYKSTQPLKNNPRGTELYMPQTHHECANTSFHILVKKETHLIMSNCKVKLCVIFRIYTIHSSKHFQFCCLPRSNVHKHEKPSIPENEFPSSFPSETGCCSLKHGTKPLVGTLHLLKRKYDHNKEQ